MELCPRRSTAWNRRYNSLHEAWWHIQGKSKRLFSVDNIVVSSNTHVPGTTQKGLQVFPLDDAVEESWVINKDAASLHFDVSVFGPKMTSSPEVMILAWSVLNGTISSTFSRLDTPWSCNSWQVSKLSSRARGRASLFVSNIFQLPTGIKIS